MGVPKTLNFDEPVPTSLTFDTEENLKPGKTTPFAIPDAAEERYKKAGPVERGVVSFSEGFGIPKSVSYNPMEAVQGVKMAVMHPSLELESLRNIYQGMTDSQQALIDRAYNLQHMQGIGNKANGFALGVYSAIPILGPAVVGALDKMQSGDWGGGVGSLLSIAGQIWGGKAAAKMTGSTVLPVEGATGEFSTVGSLPKPKEPFEIRARRTVQSMTGSGPEATTEKIIDKYKNDKLDATEKQAEANAVAEAKNQEITEGAFRKAGENKAKYNAEVAKQEAEYQKKVNEVAAHNAEQERVSATRQQLQKDLDTASMEHNKHLDAMESALYDEGSKKFDAVRAATQGIEVQPDNLISSVKNAEQNILNGIPENVKEFRSILGLEKEVESPATGRLQQLRDDVMRSPVAGVDPAAVPYEKLPFDVRQNVDRVVAEMAAKEGIPADAAPSIETTPASFDYLQSLKTRIDARLRASKRSPINPDLKRSLMSVRDAVVDDMGKIAEQAGADAQWADARDFWRQYKTDFADATGPSGSGSPVAKAYNAVDPYNTRQPIISKSTNSTLGNRHVDILSNPLYRDLGGPQAAQSAQRVIDLHTQLQNAPRVLAKKTVPERPAPIASPKDVEVEYETPKQVKQPTAPTAEDIGNRKAQILRDKAVTWAQLHPYDMGVIAGSAIAPLTALFSGHDPMVASSALLLDPAFVAVRKSFGKVLSKPEVRSWIAKPLPEELRAIENMPEDLKVDVRKGLKDFIAQQKKDGNAVTIIDPRVSRFMAGQIVNPPKTPAQMKKELEDIRDRDKRETSNPNLPAGGR